MSRLLVVYIFGRKPIDVEDCVQELSNILAGVPDAGEMETKSMLVRHDVGYTYRAGGFQDFLHTRRRAMDC
ncbi:hypothetical protein HD554DRAFT_2123146 [Boletus coccyginus]|nr:hypothetical protein HD554DRAFT_2123146 [Boletus coccyginus]